VHAEFTKKGSKTFEALSIGFVLVALICLITPYNNYYIGGTYPAGNHFPIGPVFILITLVLIINPLLRALKSRYGFSSKELILIFMMMVAASGIPSSGLMRYLLPTLVAPSYLATQENEWKEIFHQYIPYWFIPQGKNAVKYFYEGNLDWKEISLQAWSKPMLFWVIFVLAMYLVMICISTILRKQWVENEKFIFPLVRLPLEMVSNSDESLKYNQFFRNKLVWLGFGIPFFLHLINGLHSYFPAIPYIPQRFSLDAFLAERPWVAMQSIYMPFFWSVIGFSYLLTLNVSFSLWFFFFIYKFECLFGDIMGFSMPTSSGFGAKAFAANQEMGASIVLVIFIFWVGKSHFLDVLKKTISRGKPDPNEAISYRWSIIGLVCGILVLSLMSFAAGMSLWVAFSVLVFFLIVCIVFTWMTSDGGILLVHPSFRPEDLLVNALGPKIIGPQSLTILTFQSRILMHDLREFMMPNFMNGLKIADGVELKKKSLLTAMILAIIVAIGVSFYSSLKLLYGKGASVLQNWTYFSAPTSEFSRLSFLISNPSGTDWNGILFTLIGGIVMLFLIIMRLRFLWWPFHPIGYVMPSDFAMHNLWFSLFMGWLSKSILLKLGGLRAYRNARPFFLGLVLGESFIGGIWIILGLITKRGYMVLPA